MVVPLPELVSGPFLLSGALLLMLFVGVLFAGSMLLPGHYITGPQVAGQVRAYKLNGIHLFLLTMIAAGIAQFLGWISLAILYTHFGTLFVVTNIFAFAASGWLYWRSARTQDEPPRVWRDYFFGVELNPSWLGVDLKFFSYRPSLIGLALFNLSFAVVQYETYGELTLAMVLYQVFMFLYVLNYFQFERGMIHTWDISSERFGWMLVWGDYVLVPFFYCLPGWWLVHSTDPLSALAAAAIVSLFAFGFWLFRGANEQKHRIMRDPGVKIWGRPAQTLDGRLLVSGFWGIGRHLNYTGEICIYLAFALTTGFASWVPYLLPAWLASLLWHRSRRDEHRCCAKYGELWGRYKKRVRYSMLPFVY
ncbi:MAG: DUF1295 domain-containing protein [Proteobacteria bacterium]|nr:DUF1295 domain-containing protein [Pseudomonadota bacterium]